MTPELQLITEINQFGWILIIAGFLMGLFFGGLTIDLLITLIRRAYRHIAKLPPRYDYCPDCGRDSSHDIYSVRLRSQS